ncbi:hypothetical protein [Nocardia transvalensis]|uniref:hypothetical protein n=1 Tax=Nocardia transvalensis TaxID=37333 RepID=UPI00189407A6|nr:hypothetical protein [Nocardia transvalensis]MBF6331065.1 hypothetical protein [Nocardia transvalensis]
MALNSRYSTATAAAVLILSGTVVAGGSAHAVQPSSINLGIEYLAATAETKRKTQALGIYLAEFCTMHELDKGLVKEIIDEAIRPASEKLPTDRMPTFLSALAKLEPEMLKHDNLCTDEAQVNLKRFALKNIVNRIGKLKKEQSANREAVSRFFSEVDTETRKITEK